MYLYNELIDIVDLLPIYKAVFWNGQKVLLSINKLTTN